MMKPDSELVDRGHAEAISSVWESRSWGLAILACNEEKFICTNGGKFWNSYLQVVVDFKKLDIFKGKVFWILRNRRMMGTDRKVDKTGSAMILLDHFLHARKMFLYRSLLTWHQHYLV